MRSEAYIYGEFVAVSLKVSYSYPRNTRRINGESKFCTVLRKFLFAILNYSSLSLSLSISLSLVRTKRFVWIRKDIGKLLEFEGRTLPVS